MVNPFVTRKYGALILSGCLTTVCFFVGITYFNILVACVLMLAGMMISMIIGSLLLKNPYSKMLEGQGLMVWNMDSTGIISPFNVQLRSPWITGILRRKKEITDVWDRDAVVQLDNYRDAEAFRKDNYVYIRINTDSINKDRFVHYTRPVMIYNEQLQCFLTKDYFNQKETSAFAKHHLLFTNRIVEDLNINVRDFGRYVVESLKPRDKSVIIKWIVYIVIGIIIIALIYAAIKYGPMLMGGVDQAAGGAQQAVGGLKNPIPSIKVGP